MQFVLAHVHGLGKAVSIMSKSETLSAEEASAVELRNVSAACHASHNAKTALRLRSVDGPVTIAVC